MSDPILVRSNVQQFSQQKYDVMKENIGAGGQSQSDGNTATKSSVSSNMAFAVGKPEVLKDSYAGLKVESGPNKDVMENTHQTPIPESSIKNLLMQIIQVIQALVMPNAQTDQAPQAPQAQQGMVETAEAENDWGYSEGFSMLTKGELENRIEVKENRLVEVDEKLANATQSLGTAGSNYEKAAEKLAAAEEKYASEVAEFVEDRNEFLVQHDKYDVLNATLESKVNGTEITKEAAYAGTEEAGGENDFGYSDEFSMLTKGELENRIEGKEDRLEKVDANYAASAGEFVNAADEYEAAVAEFETAEAALMTEQDSFAGIEAEHFEQHDRYKVLNEALDAKQA